MGSKKEEIFEKFFEMLLSGKYTPDEIAEKLQSDNEIDTESLKEAAADYFLSIGIDLSEKATEIESPDEMSVLFEQSFEAFQKAIKIKPDYTDVYYNWGITLSDMAKLSKDEDKISLFEKSIEKYKKVIEIDPAYCSAYNNMGSVIQNMLILKPDEEREEMVHQSISNFEKAMELDPYRIKPVYNAAIMNMLLSKIVSVNEEAELYREKAFTHFESAIRIIPLHYPTRTEYGKELMKLADSVSGGQKEELIHRAVEQYEKAAEINPSDISKFYKPAKELSALAKSGNKTKAIQLYKEALSLFEKSEPAYTDNTRFYVHWGTSAGDYAKLTSDTDLFNKAFELFEKAEEIDPTSFNLQNNWGVFMVYLGRLKFGEEKEQLYERAFEKFEKEIQNHPEHQSPYQNWATFLGELAMVMPNEKAKEMFIKTFKLYEIAHNMNNKDALLFYGWGLYLSKYAEMIGGAEVEKYELLAIEKYRRAVELGGNSYNFACLLAKRKEKQEAMKYLDLSLSNYEVTAGFAEQDKDFIHYFNDADFKNIITQHKR